MGKEQVIDYVMNSPANTNKAVLEGMLDGVGGADVPTPTVEDAGKVLGVNGSGSYTLTEAGGGGSEPLIINGTFDSDTEDYTYGDTTFGEVRQAFESGRPVIIRIVEDTSTNANLVNRVEYTITLGNCTGSVAWKDGGTSVYGNDSTATLEELDAIILGTSLA